MSEFPLSSGTTGVSERCRPPCVTELPVFNRFTQADHLPLGGDGVADPGLEMVPERTVHIVGIEPREREFLIDNLLVRVHHID